MRCVRACGEPADRRHALGEQRPDTNSRASELSALTSTRLQPSSQQSRSLWKIVYGHCYFFVCLSVSFSAQHPRLIHWIKEGIDALCFFTKAIMLIVRLRHTNITHFQMEKKWTMGIVSGSRKLSKWLFAVVKVSPFLLLPRSTSSRKDYTGKSACAWWAG